MGRIFPLIMALVLLTGCGGGGLAGTSSSGGKEKYQASFLELFDTVTTIIGYAENEEEFREQAEEIKASLEEYYQLFDIYHDYEGINNLKTINDKAGIEPVPVDKRIIDFLLDCRAYYELTDGRVNVAMGSVLSLWHDARTAGIEDPENARLPEESALQEAALHCSFDTVIIDEENSTVFLSDGAQSLDVGAVAKGWAVNRVCQELPSGLSVSVGGNVQATGPKPETGSPWVVGIQSPENPEEYVHTLNLMRGSVVSSGDYQRYYQVDGKSYHHIIDSDTLYPAQYWRSISIVCEDSGLADALSTALFLLPYEEGEALLQECGAQAMWIDAEGNQYYSSGFEELIRN